MAHKPVCLVPHGWTLDDYKRHTCTDGSHSHLSLSQLRKYETRGIARVISRENPDNPRTVAVRVAAYRVNVAPAVRDRSCRFGEPLTVALAEKLEWAIVMLADIKHRELHEPSLAEAAA